MKLNNTRALVTGASRGLGRSIAAELSKRGVDVALVARKSDKLEDAAKEVGGKAYPCDLTDRKAVEALLAEVENDGPIDILVNNAGLDCVSLFPATTSDQMHDLLQVNLLTPMELVRQALPEMVARGRGHIVNVSSMAAVAVSPGVTVYATSKAGLSHFTAGIRMETMSKPTVNTTLVQIGNVKTDMLDNINSFGPAQRAVERSAKLHMLPKDDLEPSEVAIAICEAIEKNKPRVTLPKSLLAMTSLVEAPRKMAETMMSGLDLETT